MKIKKLNMQENKRIMVFGLSENDRYTFAIKLGKKLKLPVYHLDRYFFAKSTKTQKENIFLSIQQDLVNQKNWIINGNALQSMEMRYKSADIALYFCCSRIVYLCKILKLCFIKKKKYENYPRECENKKINLEFAKCVWTFDRRVSKQIGKLKAQYPQTKFFKISNSLDAEQIFEKIAE